MREMQTTALSDVREHVNAVWYGEGGTGKTTALATLANAGRVLYVNAEGGIKSRPLRDLGVKVDNIEIWGESPTFDGLESTLIEVKADLEDDPNSWVGVVWDSITDLYQALLREIVDYQVAKAERSGKDRDRFFIDRSDYGVMTEKMRLLIRRFRDLPCHFGIAALERREQDDDGEVTYQPAVTPGLQNDLRGYVDIVCHTRVVSIGEEEEYVGLMRPLGKYRGKDRFKALPRLLPNPWFDRVIAYVNDEIDEDSDPVLAEARERQKQAKREEGKSKKAKTSA